MKTFKNVYDIKKYHKGGIILSSEKLIQQPVYITKEHKLYLKVHAINLSQLVRNVLDKRLSDSNE